MKFFPSNRHPDRWVILKVKHKDEVFYRIFSTWYGDFSRGEEWMISSPIMEIEEDTRHYFFTTESGSNYKVSKVTKGTTAYSFSILSSYLKDCEKEPDLEIKVIEIEEILPLFLKT